MLKGFDVSEERTYMIFRATETFKVDVDVMRNNKMYRYLWHIFFHRITSATTGTIQSL